MKVTRLVTLIESSTLNALKAIAKRENVSVAEIVRQAILARTIWRKQIAKPGSPVRIYSVVQSVSRPHKVLHTVTKAARIALLILFALVSVAVTQAQTSGTVLKWETQSYSQSADIIRNHIVYTVQIGDTVYQIARRSTKVELSVGQHVETRVDKNHMFVISGKKEMKYDIVGGTQIAVGGKS